MIERILKDYADVYNRPVEDILKEALDQYFNHGGGQRLPKNHVSSQVRQAALREYFKKKQTFVMDLTNPCGPR